MTQFIRIVIWDVEHGACAMMQPFAVGLDGSLHGGRLAMIDSGDRSDWSPSAYIRNALGRTHIDYLFITNADQDHMSDLRGLHDAGITVGALFRNPSYTADQYRRIKLASGPLTRDAQWYADALGDFCHPVSQPFDQFMGGITVKTFWNTYPIFTDSNNLSLAAFFKYGDFSILFPGDLEKDGWRNLLFLPDFRSELGTLNVLVASHHGRENGFSDEVFKYCFPQAIVISDKPIQHDTQLTVPDYRNVVLNTGVLVKTTGKKRHVLTTRRDGWIQFDVYADRFHIETEWHG